MDGIELYATSVEAAERLLYGTFRVEQREGLSYAIPDFTRAQRADLAALETVAIEPEPEWFSPLMQPGTDDWNDYFSRNKVVEIQADDGHRYASVTSNIVAALEPRGDVAGPAGSQPAATSGRRARNYEVAQLLADRYLVEKFAIKGSLHARVRDMAVVDTARAASLLQTHIRTFDGEERAIVSVGNYGRTWKAARQRLKLHAAKYPAISATIESLVVGDTIFMYQEEQGEGWRVFGPVAVAGLVKAVHAMVAATSPESVIFAFGPELTILDIDVHDGETVLCPVRQTHAGPHDALSLVSGADVSACLSPSARGALLAFGQALETVAVDGVDCATAVRITSSHVLLSKHVAQQQGSVTCANRPVALTRPVGRDLWLARSPGPEVAWMLRDAREGEFVALCYKRHEVVQWVGPVRVISADAETITLERHRGMLPGVSGAAVVSLSDLAFLGMYDGVTLRRGLACTYTSQMYSDLCSASDLGEQAVEREFRNASNYAALAAKGLSKVLDSAFSACVPLYSGKAHVGMGLALGSKLVTLLDPDEQPLATGPGTTPLVFEAGPGAYFSAPAVLPSKVPAVVRQPAYGERVFIVACDADGYYCSDAQAEVAHVGVGGDRCGLTGLDFPTNSPLEGGLVVSMVDAAVVGVLSAESRRGMALAYAFPEVDAKVAVDSPETALARLCPYLRPGLWAEGLLLGAVTHASVGSGSDMIALAMVGDAALRTGLWIRLREAGLPTSQWQAVSQACQSNAAMVQVAHESGLDGLLRVGNAASIPATSKVYADLVEALAGAIYLSETFDVFNLFCDAVGLVPERYKRV